MQSIRLKSSPRTRAFTMMEMLIVITIISLLAALTMGAYTYAMRSSKRRITTGTFEAIKLALERYNTEFAEFPQPVGTNQMAQFVPGQLSYDTSGAACLYQALTGDGYDQIKGVTGTGAGAGGGAAANSSSDGKTEGLSEIQNKMFVEVPQTIFTRKGSTYILLDGFGHPFQYIKAAITTPTAGATGAGTTPTPNAITINSTYDLWSYAEDETNTTKKSIDTVASPLLSVKWIKNW